MSSRIRIRRMKIQREAEGYLELGMAERALGSLERLGGPAEFDVHSLYLWGEALRDLRRYDEAVEPLARAAEADPENIHIWLALGWCRKRNGQLDEAIHALEEALTADPDEPLLHYNLACYWSLAGNKDRALGYLGQALEINPRYRRLIDEEPDFDPLRHDPDFRAVVEGEPVSE